MVLPRLKGILGAELSHGNALIAYALLFLLLTAPYWLAGQVVAPHTQTDEVAAWGVVPASPSPLIQNRKFNDCPLAFIPSIEKMFGQPRSGWLATWTNSNELGKPYSHLGGLSPAYAPAWLLMHLAKTPFHYLTFLSLGFCFLSGMFLLLFCAEAGLHPVAGLISALSLALSPMFCYWLSFPMFIAPRCWTVATIYSATRLSRKGELNSFLLLAFSVYSLFLTGYPQSVVFHVYLIAGFFLYLLFTRCRRGGGSFRRLGLSLAVACALGVALTIPPFLDLVHTASESARVHPELSFFIAALPSADTFPRFHRFCSLFTFPEIFGNPVRPDYLLPYQGQSLNAAIIFLAMLSILLCFRITWGWWVVVVISFVLALVHPVYAFGVKYLGFNLSRSNPVGLSLLPFALVAPFAIDALVRPPDPAKASRAVFMSGVATLMLLAFATAFGWYHRNPIRWWMVALDAFVILILSAEAVRRRPLLLLLPTVLVVGAVSFPLMLRQNPSDIAKTSPLVEAVRKYLPPDARYAVTSPRLGVLPPNLNATLGLASIHSYNSLSSRRFHALIGALGGQVSTYGRWNDFISPDYGGDMFWMSNIAVVLSAGEIAHANLEYLGAFGGIRLYRVRSRMGYALQIEAPPMPAADGVRVDRPQGSASYHPVKTLDQADLLEFDLREGRPSLLVLSQKYHRDWAALADTSAGWVQARTLPVNSVFQGVLVPEGTKKLKLEFRPYVRFAWVSNVLWLLMVLAMVLRPLLHARRSKGETA